MKTTTKKNPAAKKTSNPAAEPIGFNAGDASAAASKAETEGRWSDAASLWGQVAEHAPSAKARSKAAGRAAAAKVRAEAQEAVAAAPELVLERDPVEHPAPDATPASEPAPGADVAAIEAAIAEGLEQAPIEPAQDAPQPAQAAPAADPAPAAPEPAAPPQGASSGATDGAPAPTAQAKPAKAKREKKTPAPTAPRGRDPRLPAAGTVMRHTVRGTVTAECVENEAGEFIYAGNAYPSIHKAAFAAQQALGMKNSGANGFRFFDLEEREAGERRAAAPNASPLARALARVDELARAAVTAAGDDSAMREALRAQLADASARLASLA
jgi:hypothetical protein